jgi:heme exporter protein A
MIAGFIDPSGGKIIPEKNYTHKEAHFVGQKYALKKNLSVEKNLSLWSYFYQKKINTDQILSDLDLTQYKDNDIEVLSDGQKRRLSIARLFIHSAPIWLLDEVHVHLDSEWQAKLNHYIYNYANEGGMVLISSNTKIELNSNIDINLTNYNV